MAQNARRPLSPHLTIWKWGPHMLVSILHRGTGVAMATVASLIFVWWLAALASGPVAYATFHHYIASGAGDDLAGVTNILARLVGIGLTWAFFQHMSSGIRHLLLDTGAGYELRRNKLGAMLTLLVSTTLTVLLWAWVFMRA